METKVCSKCKVEKVLGAFSKKARGKEGHNSQCKACCKESDQRRYDRQAPELIKKSLEYYRKNKEQIISNNRKRYIEHNRKLNEYLQIHPCIDCGESDIRILQFDHVRGVKKQGVRSMALYKWEVIEAEIAKCEVRCPNCHVLRHYEVQ